MNDTITLMTVNALDENVSSILIDVDYAQSFF